MPPSNKSGSGAGLGYDKAAQENKHSGMGVASLVIGILGVVLTFMNIFVAAAVDANSPILSFIGFSAVGGLLGNLVGLGLGLAGLIQHRHKKLFSVIGIVVNTLVIIAVLGIISLG